MTNSGFAPDFCRTLRVSVRDESMPVNLTELSWDDFEVRVCAQIPLAEAVYVIRVLRRRCPQGRVHAVIEEWPDIDVDGDEGLADGDSCLGGPSAVRSVSGLQAGDLVRAVLGELSPISGGLVCARRDSIARRTDRASENSRLVSVC